MAYGDFTLPRVLTDFGLTLRTDLDLFGHIPPVPTDPSLTGLLNRQHGLALAINTEKARSELLIAPILGEVWRIGRGQVAFFSGVAFPVDPEAGLTGVCDYILGRPPQIHFVSGPVMVVTEAKNEDMAGGLGQCAAAMVAAAPDAGMFYICTPNNPTGTLTSHADIEYVVENKPKGAVVVVDEAYLHFCDAPSALDLVKAGKDVVVLRTFSKIYGMAGIRCGMAFARPDLLEKISGFSGWNAMPITAVAAATAMTLFVTIDIFCSLKVRPLYSAG